MKRVLTWILSHRRWLVLTACCVPLVLWLGWALSHRTVALIACVVIWFGHLGFGVVAVMAGVRVWRSRHIDFFWYLWLYLNAFVIDVLSAIVMLFVAKGVRFTWKFTAVMFLSTLLMDVVRIPLLFSIIRGPASRTVVAEGTETSGQLPPQYWLEAFREIVREEVALALAAEKKRNGSAIN